MDTFISFIDYAMEFGGAYSDYVGLVGVLLILLTYALLQLNSLDSKHFAYSFLNLVGSLLLLFSLLFHWNLASVVIEIMWFLISLYGIVRYTKTWLKT